MASTLRNARYYRKQDIKLGDMATPEKFYHIGVLTDSNGDSVEIRGILELWGKVISINNNYHCSVRCSELRYDNGKTIIPIKKENQFTTSINFFRGGKISEEDNFGLDDLPFWINS